jgi:addiction module RelE/StbE family toxin
MAKIVWTRLALEDFEAIINYIRRDSDRYAELFAKKILSSVRLLEFMPESGRITPEIEKSNIRELIVGIYRIIYRTHESRVDILTIRHGARLFTLSDLI